MQKHQFVDFAERYTAAWCSQDAASVAAFYSVDGSLSVNDGTPAVGRSAITEVAQSFMTCLLYTSCFAPGSNDSGWEQNQRSEDSGRLGE